MTKQTYKAVEEYILNSIDNEGYTDAPMPSIEDKLKFLKETFIAEYGWHIKQVGQFEALANWLSGLPSSCNIDFYNYEILKLGLQWGFLKEHSTEKQKDKWCQQWFKMIAMRIQGLWNTYNI